MNKSVCKECKCNLSLNLNKDLFSELKFVMECTDIKDKTTICSFEIRQELTNLIIDEINNNYKIIDVLDLSNNVLSKIEINKQCPYYAEHLITELNQ